MTPLTDSTKKAVGKSTYYECYKYEMNYFIAWM